VSIDWHHWQERWDAQQAIYVDRERRFAALLDVLGALAPAELVVVDLGAGPGSLTQRLLDRFPRAQVTAVDLDPVLLEMGRATLGDAGGRLTWIEADLREPPWVDRLPQRPVHAVVSSTALHWLPLADLAATYRTAYQILAPGGVLLNADRFRFARQRGTIWRTLRQLADARRERELARGAEGWDAWWSALGAIEEAQPLIAERTRRFAWFGAGVEAPSMDMHEAALMDAGFDEVDIVWQDLDARIVAALKR